MKGLMKNNHLYDVEKLHTKELYCFSIFFDNTKPTTQKYFQDYVVVCKQCGAIFTIFPVFNGNLKLPSLIPQGAMFGFSDVDQDIFLVLNHILLLFKVGVG